jgi:hypothetical protein
MEKAKRLEIVTALIERNINFESKDEYIFVYINKKELDSALKLVSCKISKMERGLYCIEALEI